MRVFTKKKSRYYYYDFTVGPRRYRASTGETNENRARNIANEVLDRVCQGNDPLPRRAPTAGELAKKFLEWIDDADLAPKTKDYYRNGWRLLETTEIFGMRLDLITQDDVEKAKIPGSASNVNNMRRTISRLLHKAEEWRLIRRASKIKLKRETERKLQLDEYAEQRLMQGAALCGWRLNRIELFRDILIMMRDGGFRNEKELYPLRVEDVDWDRGLVHIWDSKTPDGIRTVPISSRMQTVLKARIGTRTNGWLFPSKRAKSGHLTTMAKAFQEARAKAVLPKSLVMYCCRHNYGTRLLRKTGDAKLVMEVMGHRDHKSALKYQHPDIESAREAINSLNEIVAEKRVAAKETIAAKSATA